MLYNITNHPVDGGTWSPEQIDVATKLFGGIVDVGFPATTPDMSDKEMTRVAEEVARDIAGMARRDGGKAAAMVAGHYVMTCYLVRELQFRGIECYVGDSNRIAEEQVQPDGTVAIVHKFQFAGFRKYPDLVYSIAGNM